MSAAGLIDRGVIEWGCLAQPIMIDYSHRLRFIFSGTIQNPDRDGMFGHQMEIIIFDAAISAANKIFINDVLTDSTTRILIIELD